MHRPSFTTLDGAPVLYTDFPETFLVFTGVGDTGMTKVQSVPCKRRFMK